MSEQKQTPAQKNFERPCRFKNPAKRSAGDDFTAILFDGDIETAYAIVMRYGADFWPDFDNQNNYLGKMQTQYPGGRIDDIHPGTYIVHDSDGRTLLIPETVFPLLMEFCDA